MHHKEEKPRYEHDCNTCVFLGQWKEYDLYYCSGEPTVVARWSDEGGDYNSGIVFAERGLIPQLVVAYKRSIKRGFINPRKKEHEQDR